MSRIRSGAALAAAAVLVVWCPGSSSASISPYVADLYAVGPTLNYVAQWNGSWSVIGGPTQQIYVGAPGLFETNSNGGPIYQYSGTPNVWNEIGGPGEQFAVGGSHVYGVGPAMNYVAQWNGNGTGWTVIWNHPVQIVYAGGFGVFATGTDDSGLYRYDGTPGDWTYLDAGGNEYEVNDTGLYEINETTFVVEQWNQDSDTWSVIGPHTNWLYAGATGLYLFDANGNIEKYSGTPGVWSVVGGPADLITSSVTSLFATGPTDNYVARYSGSGTAWTEIGGPAAQIMAGG